MAELARGTVLDRPWGRTLGALGVRGATGQLVLANEGKEYRIAFAQGAVVGATSPITSDSAVRVAITMNLITSTQAGEITRQIAAAPNRDEVEILAELARLSPDQVQRLRRRLVAQRAARTFSVDRGEFVLDDRVTIPVRAGSELDVRAVVYMGARQNLSEQRLAEELARLGAWFQLKPDAVGDLPYFGFGDADRPVLAALQAGADLADLETSFRDAGERTVRAIVYALACCSACEAIAESRSSTRKVSPPQERARTGSDAPTELRRGMERLRTPSGAPKQTLDPAIARAKSTSIPAATRPQPTTTTPPVANEDAQFVRLKPSSKPPPGDASSSSGIRAHRPSEVGRVRRDVDQAAARETEDLIAEKIALVDAKADHFALLGLTRDAAAEVIRDAYFTLARKLHPDRLASLAIADPKRDAQRLFAHINSAFTVLHDPAKRREYSAVLERGGETAVRAEEAKANELASRVMQAEQAYRRAEMALRRDQFEQALTDFTVAAELQPNEPEYQTMLAWVKFAIAPDKKAVASATRAALLRADQMGKGVTARFYLGRVERMLGREREALEHFQEVLRMKPGHAEASSEARVLESRLKAKR